MGALLASALVLVSFTPLTAQSSRPRFSAGYAYAKYLEEGGGSAPVGGYISVATAGKTGFELDLAYHRDAEAAPALRTPA